MVPIFASRIDRGVARFSRTEHRKRPLCPLAEMDVCYLRLSALKGIDFTTGTKLASHFPKGLKQMEVELGDPLGYGSLEGSHLVRWSEREPQVSDQSVVRRGDCHMDLSLFPDCSSLVFHDEGGQRASTGVFFWSHATEVCAWNLDF